MSSDYFSRKNRLKRRDALLASTNRLAGTFQKSHRDSLTTQNVGPKAIELVRSLLGEYNLPMAPRLSYTGTRKANFAEDSSDLLDGVITVNAAFKTHSGISVDFDVPIEIHDGEMLEPSIILTGGIPKVISQSSFDELVDRGSIYDPKPDRGIYDPPRKKAVQTKTIKRTSRGMFSLAANRQAISDTIRTGSYKLATDDDDRSRFNDELMRKLDQLDLLGGPTDEELDRIEMEQALENPIQMPLENPRMKVSVVVHEDGKWKVKTKDRSKTLGTHDTKEEAEKQLSAIEISKHGQYVEYNYKEADPAKNQYDKLDCLDPAEERQHQDGIAVGKDAKLREEVEVKDRGGVTHTESRGSKVHVMRDHAGDGKQYVVRFESGLEAIIDADLLR